VPGLGPNRIWFKLGSKFGGFGLRVRFGTRSGLVRVSIAVMVGSGQICSTVLRVRFQVAGV